jgi:hypothetical protein
MTNDVVCAIDALGPFIVYSFFIGLVIAHLYLSILPHNTWAA